MKTLCATVQILLCFLIANASAQQRPTVPAPISTAGRFQIIAVTIDEQNGTGNTVIPSHEMFLLDTQTGKVWRYQPNSVLNDHGNYTANPEMLIPVGTAPAAIYTGSK